MAMLRPAIALGAIAALAGCANATPSGAMPARIPGQSAANTNAMSGKASTGKVLYVGNIDGGPGVGNVLVYTASMKNPQLIRTISTGTGRPIGLWVDSQNILYVANEPNKYPASVTEFEPGASSPFFQISSFKGSPESVAVDSHQNVFVNESFQDEGWVQEFAPGSNVAERTIDTGQGGYAFNPGSMAFDPHGNLIVAESADLKVRLVKIARDTFKVKQMNLDLDGNNINGPGMGIDRAGNIYIGSADTATVSVFPRGQTEPSRVISNVPGYGMMSVTALGAVYEASGEGSVTEVAPGSNSPTNTVNCQCQTLGVAVSR